jgi:hypothetical protein
MAMSMYRAVQTGGKTQSGGVQSGFLRFSYHCPGGNEAPMQAALKVTRIKRISTMLAFILLQCDNSDKPGNSTP